MKMECANKTNQTKINLGKKIKTNMGRAQGRLVALT